LGVLVVNLGLAALIISGAYLANRINDQTIGVVLYLSLVYRYLFDHQYLGSYRLLLDPNTKSPILAQLCLYKGPSDNQSLNNE